VGTKSIRGVKAKEQRVTVVLRGDSKNAIIKQRKPKRAKTSQGGKVWLTGQTVGTIKKKNQVGGNNGEGSKVALGKGAWGERWKKSNLEKGRRAKPQWAHP